MTRKERSELLKTFDALSDEEVEKLYYDAVYDASGSQCEAMYESGYDMEDIFEQEKYEKYQSERLTLLEITCARRGIKLWGVL